MQCGAHLRICFVSPGAAIPLSQQLLVRPLKAKLQAHEPAKYSGRQFMRLSSSPHPQAPPLLPSPSSQHESLRGRHPPPQPKADPQKFIIDSIRFDSIRVDQTGYQSRHSVLASPLLLEEQHLLLDDGVVLQHAQRARRPWPHQRPVVARHGHAEETHRDRARLGCW